ncbi:MAG: MATE family efflux transporter [Synergistaceae bacterium]|jgi:putative MATE family efflux protein|nr:MATE family efflux transporter [Synergistaceae bacterium]
MDGTNLKYDLTRGGIADKLLLVALPIIGAQILMMSYNLADMFILGRVGSGAVASSGIAGMYMWLSEGFLLIGKMGAEIGVSQSLGRRDVEAAKKFSHGALCLALVIGVAYALVCGALAEPLISFFQVREAEVAEGASNYLFIVSFAIPATFIHASISGTFIGSGNSRVPLMLNGLGLALNVVLDIVFIFELGMGIEGAAAATAIAQIVACALSVYALLRKHDRPFERYEFMRLPKRETLARILRWSLPLCVMSVLFTFFTMFMSRFAARFGAWAIAVYRVGSHIESISWLIGEGVSTSVAAFVGQNYGAGRWDRIRGGVRMALVAWCAWGAAATVLIIIAGRTLFAFFLPEPALIEMGVSFLRRLAACEVFGCLEAVSMGTFRGFGRTMPPSVVSVTCNAFRVPMAYFLSSHFGVSGIWLAITISASARGLWVFLWMSLEMRRNLKIEEARTKKLW